MSAPFVPGLTLSRRFYEDAVRPILDRHFPALAHAAALIGPGSEVLGFDTAQSTDHHWGPRVMLFLGDADLIANGDAVRAALSAHLPTTFMGYSTHFGLPDDHGVRLLEAADDGSVNHRVELHSVGSYVKQYLGWNPACALTTIDWLTFPEHRLRAFTGGAVFSDRIGELCAVRERLAWYPPDIWRYLLAAQWNRIAEEEAFMARCGDVGDELGSRLVAARLVRDLMRLCFLMERQYPPYSKWFGTAFARLRCAPSLLQPITAVLEASEWHAREDALRIAYRHVAEMHNALRLTDPIDPYTSPYYDRPYQVIHADRFASALYEGITDVDVLQLPRHLGSLNQVIDSSDKLEDDMTRQRLRGLYDSRAK